MDKIQKDEYENMETVKIILRTKAVGMEKEKSEQTWDLLWMQNWWNLSLAWMCKLMEEQLRMISCLRN